MTTETKEIWKPVVGYEGIYDVSNLGRVKTVERTCYLNIKFQILNGLAENRTWLMLGKLA